MELYGKKLELPLFINTEVKITFKSLGFDFKVVLKAVDLDLPFSVLNVRLYVNKKFSNTMDCRYDFALENSAKLESILLNNIFSTKISKMILDDVKSNKTI